MVVASIPHLAIQLKAIPALRLLRVTRRHQAAANTRTPLRRRHAFSAHQELVLHQYCQLLLITIAGR